MAKRDRKRKPKGEPKWKMVERVVALIERTLDPGATVEHDIHLPVLATPEHARQCDVVVTTGPPNRRTRTIVEVQRRGKRVEPAHFDGWVAKMREVGAQHLVCVSAAGFAASVIDKAAQLGPTVRLATLRELKDGTAPLEAALGGIRVKHAKSVGFADIHFLTDDKSRVSPDTHELRVEAPNFRNGNGDLLSLNEIGSVLFHGHPMSHVPGQHVVRLESSEQFVFVKEEEAGPFRLRFDATVVVTEVAVPCEVLEYEQVDDDGATTWVLTGRTPRPDSSAAFELSLTFRRGVDGRLAPGLLNVLGAEPGDVISARAGGRQVGPIRAARAT